MVLFLPEQRTIGCRILTLFGLPQGQDMDGKPIITAFADPPAIQTIPSWDAVLGEDGCHPADRRIKAGESIEAIRQLVALGYIAQPDADHEKAVSQTIDELKYNFALAYMDALRHAEAAPILAKLYSSRPDQYRFGVQLASCHKALGQGQEMRLLGLPQATDLGASSGLL